MKGLLLGLIILVISLTLVQGWGRRGYGRSGGRGGRGYGGRGKHGGRRHGGRGGHGGRHGGHGGFGDSSEEHSGEHGSDDEVCPGVDARRRLTYSTVSQAKVDLKNELFSGRPDRYATAVRIAFHDCVGGCDGCLNEQNPDNAGFMFDSLAIMNKMYDSNYSSKMSRADFWILTAVTALEESLKFNNANLTSSYIRPVNFRFQYGRCDCPTSPVTAAERSFPAGHADYNDVMAFFKDEFGFSVRESVAILGAHTLGGASGAKGSGFDGFWKEDATASARLNNRYYSLLTNNSLTWHHVDRSKVTGFAEERWQWEAGATPDGVPAPFMLNADVALYKDIQPGDKGRSACSFDACAKSPSSSIVEEYARDGGRWIRDFAKVFEKMVSKGARKLKYPRPF